MKFEKRTDGEQTPSSPQEDKPSAGRKPVVIYIMILFIVAFLLMALSFVMHQRSNTEVLGELQDSVSAMQEIQFSVLCASRIYPTILLLPPASCRATRFGR